ncbi:uncharacterized protein SPSK_00966 [Sporothrix schenckii 1099-18]|uniref:Uncharacterized protein n=1 Tax=Sporothrix schenckii 1099-18 TaxID=1397361 RepID=A0A0F2LWF0_SPOSC|nr:uncharacterized protein SPSK_00966 [Sporothrix schenckii 1099-18]KJR81783.1 hypothetical protein SPSK_00966 [Sporothrix schenckii 1099-18]
MKQTLALDVSKLALAWKESSLFCSVEKQGWGQKAVNTARKPESQKPESQEGKQLRAPGSGAWNQPLQHAS